MGRRSAGAAERFECMGRPFTAVKHLAGCGREAPRAGQEMPYETDAAAPERVAAFARRPAVGPASHGDHSTGMSLLTFFEPTRA